MNQPSIAIGYIDDNKFIGIRIKESPFFMASDSEIKDALSSIGSNIKGWVSKRYGHSYRDMDAANTMVSNIDDEDEFTYELFDDSHVSSQSLHDNRCFILYALKDGESARKLTDTRIITVLSPKRAEKIALLRSQKYVR